MNIKEAFAGYWDVNGLIAPHPSDPNLRGSDNGVSFTSEYYIILKRNGMLTIVDTMAFGAKMSDCITPDGLLNREPLDQPHGQEGPDDYYALLNACHELGNIKIPKRILSAIWKYRGFLNNVQPGVKTLKSFLIRQPQLIASAIGAAYPGSSPKDQLMGILAIPFNLVAAVVIATSCLKAGYTDTDARRNAWHLIQVTKHSSFLCRISSYFWYKRLYKEYGETGMAVVAGMYYRPIGINPFSMYWVNE